MKGQSTLRDIIKVIQRDTLTKPAGFARHTKGGGKGKVHPITPAKKAWMTRRANKAEFKVDQSGRVRKPKSKSKQPRSATQAIKMIATREVPVSGSLTLQNEFDAVNKEFFKGRLKDATIMLANLPKVKHKAFVEPNSRVVVINTAQSSVNERKLALRHEMIHLAGIRGHGFRFESWAKTIGAPVAEYKGKFITSEEHTELKIKREVEKARLKQEAREKRAGIKRGEGQLERNGKPVARVIFYEGRNGHITGKRVRRLSDVPKSAKTVAITTFDGIGYPKGKMKIIQRDELENYTL